MTSSKKLLSFGQFYLMEAFLSKDLESALNLIQVALEKKLGKKLFREHSISHFSNSLGEGFGVRYFFDERALRLNFDKSNQVTSIDIWTNDNSKEPGIRIETTGISIVKIIPLIVQNVKNPSVGEYDVYVDDGKVEKSDDKSEEMGEGVVHQIKEAEAVTIDRQTFSSRFKAAIYLGQVKKMDKKAVAERLGVSVPTVHEAFVKAGIIVSTRVKKISNEVEIEKKEIKIDVKKFQEKEYADPEIVYKDLEDLLTLVVKGRRNSLILSGSSGQGKSHSVNEFLNKSGLVKGKDYEIVKGKVTVVSLVQMLNLTNPKLVIVDDSDSIFDTTDGINILAAALDSQPVREITYKARNISFNPEDVDGEEYNKLVADGKIPDHFSYYGKIIFISNIYYKDLPPKLLSRSLVIDITLEQKSVIKRIESILPNLMAEVPEATLAIKKEVLNFYKEMVKNGEEFGKELNLRSFLNSVDIRLSNSPRWKELVKRYS